MIAGITSKPTRKLVGFCFGGRSMTVDHPFRRSHIELDQRFPQSGPWMLRNPRVWAGVGCTVVATLVNDGWSGRPTGITHQLIVLPFTLFFLFGCCVLLRSKVIPGRSDSEGWTRYVHSALLALLTSFELVSLMAFWYESKHFARFGYSLPLLPACFAGFIVLVAIATLWLSRTGFVTLTGVLVSYLAGMALAIRCFPLNYLRSDMLPVVLWADERLIRHANPYGTMHVADRLYDFPYLPGMLVAFLPAVAARVDLRWVTMTCVIGSALLIYGASEQRFRREAALIMGIFVLSPFLQYRHELYLAPHWLALTGGIVLLQYRRFAWAAITFGVSMALYQLSWVLFPFLLLYSFRRGGMRELIRTLVLSLAGMAVVVGPFLRSALHRIASNTVGQWSLLPHALADPMNLSYWLTFLVRPDQLKWVQLVLLTGIFAFCVFRGTCGSLADMLRWMCVALTIFIALNVIVDGYFYLTLLLLMLMFTFSAAGIWEDRYAPEEHRALMLKERQGSSRAFQAGSSASAL